VIMSAPSRVEWLHRRQAAQDCVSARPPDPYRRAQPCPRSSREFPPENNRVEGSQPDSS